MLNRLMDGLLVLCIVFGFLVPGFAQTGMDSRVMEKFKKSFPQIQAETLRKTDIEGMYEVYIPGRMLYYFPEKDYIFAGSIWTSKGSNLTEMRINEILTEKVKNIPLEKALKIGNGKNVVIEFTDPDCPYCRDASKFLSEQTNITRYVIFVPLAMHKDAEQKVRYIFCSKDRGKAYEEAMKGILDGMNYEVCKDEDVEKLLKEHKQISEALGINSTPQFWINGRHVSGADIPLLKKLLGQDKQMPQYK